MSFFDVGDAAQPGAITVLPPTDSNVGVAVRRLHVHAAAGELTGPPWGTFTPDVDGLHDHQRQHATYNGQWVQMRIPIPDNYTCNYSDPMGCWTRVNFDFPSQTSVTDTTTWSANIEGDPVRLIE